MVQKISYGNWNWNVIHLWVTCWQLRKIRKNWVSHYVRPVSTLYALHTPGAAGNPKAVSFSRARSQRSCCLLQIISLVVNVGIDLSGSSTHPVHNMQFRNISKPNIAKGIMCVQWEIPYSYSWWSHLTKWICWKMVNKETTCVTIFTLDCFFFPRTAWLLLFFSQRCPFVVAPQREVQDDVATFRPEQTEN